MTPARTLIARRDYWRLATVGQLSALPDGMTPLAYTLLTAAVLGSYRVGSLLVGAGVIAQALAGPGAGRFVDRIGHERGLRALLLLAAAGYALLAIAATHVPEPVLVLLAVLPALPNAALSGGVLSVMARALPRELLSPAVALNDTLLEGTLIVGPLLAAGLAVIAPTAAIGALAVAMVIAAATVPRGTVSRAPRRADRGSLLRGSGIGPWLLVAAGTGVLFGGLEVGALGIAHRLHGGSATAALLLTVVSGSSALAGILFTVLGHRLRQDPRRRAALLLAVPGGCLTVVAMSHSWPVSGAALAALGLCTAPLITTQSLGVSAALPQERRTEGFTLMASVGSGGYALGALMVAVLPLSLAEGLGGILALAVAGLLAGGARGRRTRPTSDGRPGRRGDPAATVSC